MLKNRIFLYFLGAAFVVGVSIAGYLLVGAYAFTWAGQADMSVHGVIALILGGVGTLALTGLLIALVFYSNRAGYDDRANRPEE